MKNSIAVVCLFAVALGAVPAVWAQDQPSKFELYGGYSYVRFNINSEVNGLPPSLTFNGNGGGGELGFALNRWLSALADVSGYWATNATRQGAAFPYLFGPRASLRHGRVRPFVQVLLGGIVTSSGIEQIGWQTHFAMTAGGGIEVKVSEHLWIRPVQAEYFLTKLPDGLSNRQNNFRFATGIAFRFG